jgi:hypothetical protein
MTQIPFDEPINPSLSVVVALIEICDTSIDK